MTPPGSLIREARTSAGLTQSELARELGVDQSVVARLERPASDPRVSTLTDALVAAGFTLELRIRRENGSVDESQIADRLALSPAERLATFQSSQRNLSRLAKRARRAA